MAFFDPLKQSLASFLANKKSNELKAEQARKTDAIRQQEYSDARKSILGDLSSLPPSTTQECLVKTKASRRKERLAVVNNQILSCPKHAKEAARLRENMDEVENMRCAKHVYIANDPNAPAELRDNPPPGFLKPTAAQLKDMGLTDALLTPKDSQFKAALYMKDPEVWGENPKPVGNLAFRGSTAELKDWQNNFNQDSNLEAPYYKNAVLIGNALAKNHAIIHFVGHSLGGGLSSAAQGGSGLTASTYNSSGLHPNTVARYSEDLKHMSAEADKIKAIRIDGELLTKTQETGITGLLANKSIGIRENIAPSHDEPFYNQLQADKKADSKDSYESYLHGMDEVIDSTEKIKLADEKALKDCRNEK